MNSNRLTYKKFTLDDVVNYTRWYSNDDVMKHIMGRGLTAQETKERFAKVIALNSEYSELGFYAVSKKDDNTFIGLAKLVYKSPVQAEVGYGSLPEFWGKGYASEMLAAMIVYAKTILPVKELMAIVNPVNLGSKKVLINQKFELYDTGIEHNLPVEYYKLELG